MTPDSSNSSPDQKLLPLPSYLEIPVYGQPSPREEPKKYNPDYHMCHGHGIPQDIIPPCVDPFHKLLVLYLSLTRLV